MWTFSGSSNRLWLAWPVRCCMKSAPVGAADGKRFADRFQPYSSLINVIQPKKRVLATQNTARIGVRAHLNFYALSFRTRTPRGGTRPTTRLSQELRPVGRVP